MDLFQLGDFKLHSGSDSGYKIDCDALTDGDLDALAWMAVQKIQNFGSVIGIPRGGLRFAEALKIYITKGDGRTLIVDDVFTTGASMKNMAVAGEVAHGLVIFNRAEHMFPWCSSIFDLSQEQHQARLI